MFSGDTPYSKNLVALARDADVFVCEVMAQSVYEQMMARAKADADAGNANSVVAARRGDAFDAGGRRPNGGGGRGQDRRAESPAAGRARSGRRRLPVTKFIDGVRAQFGGEVIVGQDLMVL